MAAFSNCSACLVIFFTAQPVIKIMIINAIVADV